MDAILCVNLKLKSFTLLLWNVLVNSGRTKPMAMPCFPDILYEKHSKDCCIKDNVYLKRDLSTTESTNERAVFLFIKYMSKLYISWLNQYHEHNMNAKRMEAIKKDALTILKLVNNSTKS